MSRCVISSSAGAVSTNVRLDMLVASGEGASIELAPYSGQGQANDHLNNIKLDTVFRDPVRLHPDLQSNRPDSWF